MIILNFIKKIIFFIIKEIFSFLIKMTLLFFLILIIISTILFSKKEMTSTKNKIFIEINLAENFPEQKSGLKFLNEKSVSFYELLNSLEKSINDNRVNGVILNLENLALNSAQIEEMGEILKEIREKSKIKIYSYAENIDKKNFYLASYTDYLFMPRTNSTTVNIFPYFSENFYVKDFLDKFGVKFNIINIGDYKSYQENLSHNSMTKENREDKTRILESRYEDFLDTVSKNLDLDKEKFSKLIEGGNLVASSSIELYKYNLIYSFANFDEIKNEIGKDNIVSIYKYSEDYIPSKNKKNKIYILNLEGEMGGDIRNGILSDITYIDADKTIKILDEIKNDETIKGIILRINSPGGSALIADKISKKIEEVVKIKPIYTSMSGVCASGGYYISANTNKIFVDKNTITGSIGVISIVPEITETLKKLNINNEKIMKGEYADLYSSTDFNKKKYDKIKNSNMRVYQDFLEVVSKGRKIEISKLEKIARGRVWTGIEAVKIGLADEIGGLKDSIREIAKDNNIENYAVVSSENELNFKDFYNNYSSFIKIKKLDLLKSDIKSLNFKESFLNKPIMYYIYEI